MHSWGSYGLFAVLGLFIIGISAHKDPHEENENVSVSTKEELLGCVANQYYLEELFSIVIQEGKEVFLKVNTYLRCICDPLRKDKKFINIRKHPNNKNLWLYSYICSKRALHEERLPCTEYEICKRDIYEYYSSNVHSLKYFDHSHEYCSCDLPRVCNISEEEPKMTTYRCMHSKEKNDLPLCRENEVYKREIYQNESKLDTKLLCKCDTLQVYKKHISFKRDKKDPSLWTYSYRCFETYFIEENSTCRDEGICRRDFYEEYGHERAGEKYLESSDIYCTCKYPQVCNISLEAPSITTYRCMDQNVTELRPCNAYQKEVQIEEIFHFETTSKGRTAYKVDTIFKCMCKSEHFGFTQENITLDNNTMIRVSYCLGNHTDYIHQIGKCKIGDYCKTDTYIEYGEERIGFYPLPFLRCICENYYLFACSTDSVNERSVVYKCKFRECSANDFCSVTLRRESTRELVEHIPKMCECKGDCVFSREEIKNDLIKQWYKCNHSRT